MFPKVTRSFFEVPEVVQDVCAVAVFVIYRFEPNFVVGSRFFGQKIITSMYVVEGLTLDVTIDLERPPGDVFELEGECPCWRMKTSILLISFLDAYSLMIALITWHVHRAIFAMLIRPKAILCWFEEECWNMGSPRDKHNSSSACSAPI